MNPAVREFRTRHEGYIIPKPDATARVLLTDGTEAVIDITPYLKGSLK